MSLLLKNSIAAERARGLVFSEPFKSMSDVVKNEGVLVSSPVINNRNDGMYFDGIDDAVNFGKSGYLSSVPELSVLCWVKGDGQDGKYVLGRYDIGYNKRQFLILTSAETPFRKMRVFISEDGRVDTSKLKQYFSSIDVFDNKWHQVGFTFTNNTLKLYIDGVEDTACSKVIDNTVSFLIASDANLSVGNVYNSGVIYSGTVWFNGYVKDVKIFSKVLTAQEIKDYYNNATWNYLNEARVMFTFKPEYYDSTNKIFYEQGRKGFIGTHGTDLTFNNTGGMKKKGDISIAYSVSTSPVIDINKSIAISGGNDRTILSWIKIKGDQPDSNLGAIYSQGAETNDNLCLFGYDSSIKNLFVEFKNNDHYSGMLLPETSNEWNLAGMSFSGTSLSLNFYQNNEMTTIFPVSNVSTADQNWSIGYNAANDDHKFYGDIDQLWIWDKVLTPMQVLDFYSRRGLK